MQAIYQHDPSIVSRQIAGEMILVPIRKSVADMESIYTLNETAARVWELFDGKNSMTAVLQRLTSEFEVNEPEAQTDLADLVDSLLEIGAIEKVAG